MKKKIIALILMVAIAVMCFSGCTFIKKNYEREANEVLATISDKGFTLTITRNELLTYTNYMVNQYSQYGYTPDFKTLVPDIFDYLITQKYLVIVAMDYLKNLEHRKSVMAGVVIAGVDPNTPEGILTVAERYAAIKTVNDTFQTEIDGYVDAYDAEQRTKLISEREKDLEAYKADGYSINKVEIKPGSYKEEYLTGQKLDLSKVFLNIILKKGEATVTVELPYSSSLDVSEKLFSTEADSSGKMVVTKEVSLKYDEVIEDDSESSYKTYTSDPISYKLVNPRGTEPKPEETVDPVVGSVKGRYDLAVEDKYEYFNYNAGTTSALKEAYRQFRQSKKNMLINFETRGLAYYYDSQFESEIMNAFKHELGRTAAAITDQMVNAEYQVLLNRQAEEYSMLSDKEKVTKFTTAIKGSNNMDLTTTYYVPVEALRAEGYELDQFFCIAHVLFKFDDKQTAFITKESTGMKEDAIKALRDLVSKYTLTNRSNPDYDPEFECPCEDHVNDPSTCTKPADKPICPSLAFDPDGIGLNLFGTGGNEGIYEEISRVLNAAPLEERFDIFKKYMTLYNDDGGALVSTTGYLIPPDGIAHGYDGDDFPNLARALFGEDPSVGSAFVNGSLGYAFTSYGLHLMMISFTPFADPASVSGNALNINMKLNLKGDTHFDLIKEKLRTNAETKAYNDFVSKYKEDDALAKTKKEDKLFKKLMKDLGLA